MSAARAFDGAARKRSTRRVSDARQAIIDALRREDAHAAFAAARRALAAAPNDLFLLRVVVRMGPLVADHAAAAEAAARAARHPRATTEDRIAFVARAMDVSAYDEAEAMAAALWHGGERAPALADLYARLLVTRGATDEAACVLRSGGETDTLTPRLAAQLVGLPDATDADLAAAATLSARSTSEPLQLALARAFDRRGDPTAALRHLRDAEPLRPRWDEESERARIDWAVRQYEGVKKAGHTSAADDVCSPIYLCGPPRSGGTYLQGRLCAAYRATSVGERGSLPLAFHQRSGAPLSPGLIEHLRRADAAGLRRQAGPDPSVDKTPVNALFAGLLAVVHPAARMIRNGRSLRETALSIWMHDLPLAYAYAGSLEGTARYLALHEQTLDRWEAAGLAMLRVDHETVVGDPASLPALADRLDLEKRTEIAAVRAATHSAVQVRQRTGAVAPRYDTYSPLLRDTERRALEALPS